MTQPYEIRAYEHVYRPNGDSERIIFSLYVRDLPFIHLGYVEVTARLIQKGFGQGMVQFDKMARVVVVNDDGSTYEP